jgi:hypothetical protein
MAIFGAANQLLQIDTGKTRTYLYNQSLSPIAVYSSIGEAQVPGQRYFGAVNPTVSNPFGADGIFKLVYYKSTANPAPQSAPAPVYWVDNTLTSVTGVESEGFMGINGPAGYLMLNTTDLPTLTAAMLTGSTAYPNVQVIIQVAGVLIGGISPAAIVAGDFIYGATGNWTPARSAAGTYPGYQPFGRAMSAVSGGLCNILLDCDII